MKRITLKFLNILIKKEVKNDVGVEFSDLDTYFQSNFLIY